MKKIKIRTAAAMRGDGAETRARIIECAGRLIAENGFAKTTSKSICALARVNLAAVNYHFGSREGLYHAVISEVLTYMMNMEKLQEIYASEKTPHAKVEALVDLYIESVFKNDNWHVGVWTREIISPSPQLDEVLRNRLLPKFDICQKIFAQYLGLQENDPKLYTYIVSTIAPFALSALARRNKFKRILFGELAADDPDLIVTLKTFVFAGLDAIKA